MSLGWKRKWVELRVIMAHLSTLVNQDGSQPHEKSWLFE